MREIIRKNEANAFSDALKSANVTITLEGWPCAVAVLGICATTAFVAWVNTTNQSLGQETNPDCLSDAA